MAQQYPQQRTCRTGQSQAPQESLSQKCCPTEKPASFCNDLLILQPTLGVNRALLFCFLHSLRLPFLERKGLPKEAAPEFLSNLLFFLFPATTLFLLPMIAYDFKQDRHLWSPRQPPSLDPMPSSAATHTPKPQVSFEARSCGI